MSCTSLAFFSFKGFGDAIVLLQVYLGLAWTAGCAAFGLLIVKSSSDARIARQYLCQAAVFMCGLSILAFSLVQADYYAYVIFAWVYGASFTPLYLNI